MKLSATIYGKEVELPLKADILYRKFWSELRDYQEARDLIENWREEDRKNKYLNISKWDHLGHDHDGVYETRDRAWKKYSHYRVQFENLTRDLDIKLGIPLFSYGSASVIWQSRGYGPEEEGRYLRDIGLGRRKVTTLY